MYDFNISAVINFIKSNKLKRVLFQFANGLKHYSNKVIYELSKEVKDVELIISGASCYGACDVAFDEAVVLGVDGIVHYGHTAFPEAYTYARQLGLSICFIEAFSTIGFEEVMEKLLNTLQCADNIRNIGVTTSVQHAHILPTLCKALEEGGYRVFIGKGSDRVKYPGQVLGCDYTAAITIADNVDIFVHFGGGIFHALGLALTVQKPVLLCDPFRCEVRDLTKEARKVKAARLYYVTKALNEARNYGIIIGCKWRQRHIFSAKRVKEMLESKGYKTMLISSFEITPDTLENYPELDAFVITACPRIPIDDYKRYHRPILTVLEALIIAGCLKLEEWTLCDWTCNEKALSNAIIKG